MSSRGSYKTGSRRHDLPEEIIEDIILKLPVKSIIRFRSVSKSWFKLIKSTSFINKHLNKSEESLLVMLLVVRVQKHLNRRFLALCLYDDPNEASASLFLEGVNKLISIHGNQKPAHDYASPVLNFELPQLPCNRGSVIDLVGHCNGILCLMTDTDMTDSNMILWVNPSLKEIKTLPDPPSFDIDPVEECELARNGIYPVEYCKLAGFGFDNKTMDFKVVRIMNLECWGPLQRADVYNLKSNAWRKLDEFPFVVEKARKCCTFFNGVIHWCVVTQEYGCRLLAFNMADELFHLMEFPQGWNNSDYDVLPALFVLNQESLAFVSYQFPDLSSQFVNVWTMNKHDNGETWTKLYSIGPLPQLRPLSFPKKHKFFYETYDGKLFSYDLLNKQSSEVCDASRLQGLEMGECRSSLVSINM